MLTNWIAIQFKVDLQQNAKISELKAALDQAAVKFEKEYIKRSLLPEISIEDNSSIAVDTISIKVQSENADNFLRKSSDVGLGRFNDNFLRKSSDNGLGML